MRLRPRIERERLYLAQAFGLEPLRRAGRHEFIYDLRDAAPVDRNVTAVRLEKNRLMACSA